jgi:hypothetical protein
MTKAKDISTPHDLFKQSQDACLQHINEETGAM